MIRPPRADDRNACAALLAGLPEWFGIPESNAAYVRSLETLPAFVAVDDETEALQGFVALQPHGHRSAEILVMAVDREMHHQGLGRALIGAAERWCAEHDVGWLHVKTRGPSTYDEAYERTRRFYRGMGFEVLYESLTEWGPEDAALVLVEHLDC
jgi:GNAT superfamily N-acetyltransferase